jgi:hypothetical protein
MRAAMYVIAIGHFKCDFFKFYLSVFGRVSVKRFGSATVNRTDSAFLAACTGWPLADTLRVASLSSLG